MARWTAVSAREHHCQTIRNAWENAMKHRISQLVSVLALIAALAACASYPRLTAAERLTLYRAHAGEPVRNFQFAGSSLNGWTPLDNSTLAVWTRPNQAFLLELMGPCMDLNSATAISVSNMMGQVSARFDSVRVIGGVPSVTRMSCRIDTIRPLDVKALRKAEAEKRQARIVEREAQDSGT
jgi:hypothetical protein